MKLSLTSSSITVSSWMNGQYPVMGRITWNLSQT
jgi:hypothetical protein